MTKLTSNEREKLPASSFAFQAQRKEPIENAAHVRNAIARLSQVDGVTDAERKIAWQRVLAAARRYHVTIHPSGRAIPQEAQYSKRGPKRR